MFLKVSTFEVGEIEPNHLKFSVASYGLEIFFFES